MPAARKAVVPVRRVIPATTLGEMIDTLYEMRATRIDKQRVVDDMKVHERTLKDDIITALKKQKLAGSKGAVATASISKSTEPVAEDWKKTYAYIKKNDAFHLLHQRIASTAWRELYEAGVKVPGIGAMEIEDLSLTKAMKG